jgi:maltooligosyltrehalose trehalohydrolase
VHLVLENDTNQASMLRATANGLPVAGTAQWNDDLHHAVHVLATGERDGYYADYADDPVCRLALALAEGFIYQGSPRRSATASGAASRARGCRRRPSCRSCRRTTRWATAPSASASTRWATRCACARPWPACCCRRTCRCCSWATSSRRPRRSCTSATSGPSWPRRCPNGRRSEFGGFAAFKDEAARARIPDPNAESTFLASKLNWRERGARAHFERFSEVQQLLALRHKLIVPRLAGSTGAGVFFCENDTLRVQWDLGPAGPGGSGSGSARLHMLAHFGTQQTAPLAGSPGAVVYRHGVHEDGDWHSSQAGPRRGVRHAGGARGGE